MSEVGVDPERVAQAATALEQLRDALTVNVPVIVNTMSEYGQGGGLGILKQAQSRSVDDAAEMRARARLAALWLAQNVSVTAGGLVDIPWSGPALDDADATAEAQALAAAESDKNPAAAMAAIQAIEADLKDQLDALGSGDSLSQQGAREFLKTFYNTAAPQVANLAATLHQDGANPQLEPNQYTVLTKAAQQIMTTFGAGLAATDKNGLLSAPAVHDIADAPDIWSSSMLVRFGPPGSQWATQEGTGSLAQPSLLAQITDTVVKDEQNGTLRIPLGSQYNRYELMGPDGYDQLMNTLASYDPLTAMLQADTQNKNAAMQVMGGQQGAALAKMLLSQNYYGGAIDGSFQQGAPNDKGQYPGFFALVPPGSKLTSLIGDEGVNEVDPQLFANFLNASTSGARGGGPASLANPAYASAMAAMNIIANTPAPKDGMQDDPAIQQALLATAQRYMLDLAQSLTNPYGSGIRSPETNMPVWHVLINAQGGDSTALSKFLQQISANSADAAALDASAKVTFGNIYAQSQLHTLPAWFDGAQANNAMAGLLGRIQTEANNVGINLAKDTDAQNAEYNQILQLTEDSAGSLPIVGDAADAVIDPAKDLLGLLGVPTEFSTDNAASAEQIDSQDFADQSTQIHVSMLQGLLSNGASDLLANAQLHSQSQPASQQWLRGNQIVLTKQDYGAFLDWYQNLDPGLDSKYGISGLESRYGYYYNQQGGTSSEGGSGAW
jgi:hypothetical protein